jgi:hypothetical protein
MNFINTHFNKIVLVLLLLALVQECSNSSKLGKLEKQAKIANARLDSVCTSAELIRSLEVEGLKAEKRMIQSTDRTILDVNRQSEIDAQLKKLEK